MKLKLTRIEWMALCLGVVFRQQDVVVLVVELVDADVVGGTAVGEAHV